MKVDESQKSHHASGANRKALPMFVRDNLPIILAIVYLLLYVLLISIFFFDYGLSIDDALQRRHTLVNYKYINEVLFGRTIPELGDLPNLMDYKAMYGVAIQLPTVLCEDLFNFSLTSRQLFLIRRLWMLLVCITGYVFFYFALKECFSKRAKTADRPVRQIDAYIPLLGTIMVSIYPRLFSTQFADVKNPVFAACNMLVFFTLVRAVERRTVLWHFLLGCAIALAVNTRMMAVVYIPIVIGYYVMHEAFVRPRWGRKVLVNCIVMVVSFCAAWTLMTPKAWTNPIGVFVATFSEFASYDKWNGTMVFMGNLITCEQMPWYYLFVWFGISIPIVGIVLFLFGEVSIVRGVLRSSKRMEWLLTDGKWPLCASALFWGSVLSVIVLHSRIYVGWHHLYYVYVFFCVVACYGIWEAPGGFKGFAAATLCISLASQLVWIIRTHPGEAAYFNVVSVPVASQFDREEWRLSSYSLLEWILNNDDEASVSGETVSHSLLTEEEKGRLWIAAEGEEADYIVTCYRNEIGNEVEYPGYEEVYTIWDECFKVGSVFAKSPA